MPVEEILENARTLGARNVDPAMCIIDRLQEQSNQKHQTFRRHLKWGKFVQCCGICCDFGSCLKEVTLVDIAVSSEKDILAWLRHHSIAPQDGSSCTDDNCPGRMKLLSRKTKKRKFDDMEEEEE